MKDEIKAMSAQLGLGFGLSLAMFNLRNKTCQKLFTKETDENISLIRCFDDTLPFEIQSKNWLKSFNAILHKCFKKIRVVKKELPGNKAHKLFQERIKLKKQVADTTLNKDVKQEIEAKLEAIEEEIGDEISEEYGKEILETIKSLGGDHQAINGSGRNALWKMLKTRYPKIEPVIPVGKRDKSGNLVTSHTALKDLYLNTYLHRLRNRPEKSEIKELKKLKDELFDIRLRLANSNKSVPWSLDDLEKVLKTLKPGKSRDPNGWVRDLFFSDVAGKNLKLSILKLFNKIKEENFIPDFIRKADITTIYKGKGEKSDLENDRGIFLVTTFRTILMKLIYREKYDLIDSNMSDSQVGGRKGKNVRNHTWLLNGIICDVLSTNKKKPVDIQIVDYKQCFDTLWLQECLNDLYDSGVNDDKLALLYNVNSNVKVAVKTPVGKTERKDIMNVITQGDVFGPILCSNQIDTFGRECLMERKYTYSYKGEVDIPPLGMIDDLVCVSECGHRTTMLNAFLNHKTSSKKLQFGVDKCKKLHVGLVRREYKCQNLKIDKWEEIRIRNEENVEIAEDIFVGEHIMEEKSEEKYLGDIITTDGKNIKNILARVAKGKGIVIRIFTILDAIPLGKRYFEIGLILRDVLLVSSMLFNSEAWYNVTQKEIELLETVDTLFLRKLIGAPKSTPKEMLYLEMGLIQFRDIIREKRLRFLYYILSQEEDSIIFKFLKSQIGNRTKRDWVTSVFGDLENLNMGNMNIEEIKNMKQTSFEGMVKENIRINAFERLEKIKNSHSKVKEIEYKVLKIQKYLQPNKVKITKDECKLIFKLRCKVMDVKANMKKMYVSLECGACGVDQETQEHILECEKLCKKEDNHNYNYKKLYNGTVSEKLNIAKKFRENYERLKELK